MKKNLLGLMTISICAIVVSSCSTPKNVTYMQGFEHNAVQAISEQKRITVQPDDRLSIVVSSKDPELAEMFNLMYVQPRLGQKTSVSTYNGQTSAYTVDPDGYIDFPIIGKIYVMGLHREQVANTVKEALIKTDMLKDPMVTVEFLNATVTILGDVRSPGEYPIDRDNLNILQAISKAGDLTITGMRENVLVVREENGQDRAYRLDLTDTKSLMQSPAFYLQQNDIVYIEPNDMKKRDSTNNANTILTPSFWMSVASFLMTVGTTFGVLIFK